MYTTRKGGVILFLPRSKTVMRFRHSSFYMGRYCASQNKTLEEKYLVDEKEYAAHGGSFPLIIENVGVIGCITVSGLAQEVKWTTLFGYLLKVSHTNRLYTGWPQLGCQLHQGIPQEIKLHYVRSDFYTRINISWILVLVRRDIEKEQPSSAYVKYRLQAILYFEISKKPCTIQKSMFDAMCSICMMFPLAQLCLAAAKSRLFLVKPGSRRFCVKRYNDFPSFLW